MGEITKVDPTPVNDALDNNYIPVVSTVALGTDAETSYNITPTRRPPSWRWHWGRRS